MPTLKSAAKRDRTSTRRQAANLSVRTGVKSMRKDLLATFEGKNAQEAEKLYKTYCSLLDKAAKKKVISRNTADRRKARAANKLRALKA